MATPVCYIVDKKVDGYIASKWGWTADKKSLGMNPMKVASLRGLYDQNAQETGGEPLLPDGEVTEADLDKAFEKLMKFRAGIKAAHQAKMASGTRNIDRAYDALRGAYSLHERRSRIGLLSNLFSWEVDRLMEGSSADRQSFVNGFMTVDGQYVGGEQAILEGVYNIVLETKANWFRMMHNAEEGFKAYQNADRLNFVGAPTNVEEFRQMCEHRYNEYHKLLENWNELIPFVLKDLVKKEGVKLGIKKEFAVTASTDNFGENDIAAKWDMSESKRDGWMENSDMQSAFGSVGQQVRRILATVPQVEMVPQYETYRDLDGQVKRRYTGMKSIPVVDDLGNQQFMDATKTHQALMEYLKGIQDSEHMLQRLCKEGRPGEAKIPWMQPIVDVLVSNPQARTQFFCDFKKNFQPYSVMWEDKREGSGFIKNIKTRILNRPTNVLKGKYDMVMSPRGKFPVNAKLWGSPVFDETTKEINWQRLAELRKKVLEWVQEEEVATIAGQKVYGAGSAPLINNGRNATIKIDGKQQRLTFEMRREFLIEVFSSLGMDVNVDTIDSILTSRDIYTVREQLEQLLDPKGNTGFLYAAGVKSLGDKNVETLQAKGMKYRGLYTKFADQERTIQPVKEHSEKLLDVINKHQEGYRVESRARYNGNTMYSFVAPSYLGDRLETIQNFVDNNDKPGLQRYLTEEYLQSPFFVDDEYLATNGTSGRILNMWLSELVAACKDPQTTLLDSVAAIFNYERDLGREDKKFEDFTSREYGIDMLVHFFADEQQKKGYGGKGSRDIRKKLSAMYPVFILGDAGVSKYIRAPRICSAVYVNKEGKVVDAADNTRHHIEYRFDAAAQDKVIEQFWNIYMQEKRRIALDDAITHDMYANGKKVKHPKGEFSILTFLNPTSQEYQDKYAIPAGKEFDEGTIRQIIRSYMDDATETFQKRMDTLGVLEKAKQGKKEVFRNISSFATPENIDSKIQEFFWNTKLATACQLQMMTIDPSFYHGTKDLQKRYKEIHAPGNVLDTQARDFDGFLYSNDGIERVVYFNDITINSEKTNSEFMDVIKKVFKDNPDVIDTYRKNSLTDGQGYRTLTSYRRVKGMAGQWTRNMEEAYKAIMQIRNKHIVDDSEVTEDELQQIAEFSLVLQPIKPYMFTHEKYPVRIAKRDAQGNMVNGTDGQPLMIDTYQYIPVQHKYAEALIIPELLPKGNKLRDLGLWMDVHNVDMVGSTKIAKVGCFGQTSIDKVTDKASLEAAMSQAYIHKLPYKDYRIQTNVPEHINSSQLFGTQVRKLIMAGLDMEKGYYASYLEGVGNFNGTVNLSTDDNATNAQASMEGRNLLALYNSLICANIFDSYEKFAQNAGDIQELSNLLQQSTVGSMREAMDNLFAYVVTGNDAALQKFMIPLFEGGLEHDAAALILSTFKKIVNKQQISGGSAVQVSAFGINGYEEDGGLRYVTDPDNPENILYAEIEMPFDKSFIIDARDANGNVSKQKISLQYDKYCNPDGTLIPSGEPIAKGTKEWKKYQSYTYKEVDGKLVFCKHDDKDAKVYKPLIETEYPDILSILAYRIPTERDYSMINCQIKRFTPKTAGGTMKVPPEGTSIAGFDFDIDKLYFMQREYHKYYNDKSYVESNFSESDKYAVWGAFYAANEEIKDALEAARVEAEAKDPSLVETMPIRNKQGQETGRVRTIHKTTLNSYWDAANITEGFGKDKHTAFAETAQQEGIKPSLNQTKGDVVEWMEEYDFTKSPEENSRASRNNLLITLIQARLMDPQTVKQRYTPGGFANASKAARLMRELFHGDLTGVVNGVNVNISALEQRQDDDTDPEPNYDPTDPYTILVYNQQNQVAGKLIGIFANQNTNHAFASSMDVFELNEPIAFCGKSFKDLLHKRDKDEAAQIDLNMAEFLAASVDAVKDPVLNFLNLNTATADAGALLARLGYNTKEIGLLFNQPAIRKVCQDSFNRGANINTVVDNAKNELMAHVAGFNPNEKVQITENDLAYGIVRERQMLEGGQSTDDFLADNARMQYAVLDLFSHILQVSNDISNFVLNTKFTASNAVASTFGGMYAQQLKVDAYVDKFPKGEKDKGSLSYTMVVAPGAQATGLMSMPIDNDEKLTTMKKKDYLHYVRFNPFAYEQAMYDANRRAIKLLSKYFPYERPLYSTLRDKMQSLARFGTLSEDDINDIHSNIPVAILAKQTRSLFNGEAGHIKDGEMMNMTNREYYRERFAEDLMDMIAKDPEGLGKLEIFKYLSPESEPTVIGKDPVTGLDKTHEVWRIQMQDIGGMDADTKEAIRESWAYLMEVKEDGYFDSQDYAELGRDLFMYCFYQLGFDFSPLSFMHLAPVAVKDSIKVERNMSVPMQSMESLGDMTADDVVVWSPNVIGGYERADEYGANRDIVSELHGNTYQLPDKLVDNANAVRTLINEAKSHPELRFRIDRELSEDEFKMFSHSQVGIDVPSNIYFSQATLDNVSLESKEAVSYGKERTYRQLLNEILEGREQVLNSDEFAQMWILNHLDNMRFVLDTSIGNKRLSEIITEQTSQNGNTLRDGMQFRDSITIDISKYQNDNDMSALSSLVKVDAPDGKIQQVTWCPCIKIGDSYYMAESNTDLGFNVNKSLAITYRKVVPWGSSKTIEYDINQKLAPAMRYQTSMNVQPQRNIEYSLDNSNNSSNFAENSNNNGVRQRNRQILSERFTQAELKGCTGKLEEAEALLQKGGYRSIPEKSGSTSGVRWEGKRAVLAEAQIAQIEDWAKNQGIWIDNTPLYLKQQYGNEFAQGGEAVVYASVDGTKVIKEIGLQYFIEPQLLLDRIVLHNILFPETAMTLTHFGKDDEGRFVVIVEQPFIQGEYVTQSEIVSFMKSIGFEQQGNKKTEFVNNEEGIQVNDLHNENVLKANNAYYVIDADIRLNTSNYGLDGTRVTMREQPSSSQTAPFIPENAPSGDSQSPEPLTEQSNGSTTNLPMSRRSMETYIFDEFTKAVAAKNGVSMTSEDMESMRRMLQGSSTQDLTDTVTAIRQACRKNGVMMLDDQGNPMMGC